MTVANNIAANNRRLRLLGTGGFVLLLLLAVAVLEWLPVPEDTILWRELFNAGHAPLFAVIFVILTGLIRLWASRHKQSLWMTYIIAWVPTVGLGAVTELLQIIGPRDADLGDFIRDIIGAVAGVLLVHAFVVWQRKKSEHRRFVLLAVSGSILLFAAVFPAVMCVRAYVLRDLAFPQLAGCNHHWETWFLEKEHARYRLTAPPADWPEAEGAGVAQVVFAPAEYPSFGLAETYPVWQSYSQLRLSIFNPADTAMTVFVRIQDREHNQEYNDRYNGGFLLSPGPNRISIPLSEVAAAPARRHMDLSKMSSLAVFMHRPEGPVTLFVDDIRLE